MVRISNVNLPPNKRILIALTYIKGIGNSLSKRILEQTRIDKDKKSKDLSEKEEGMIREVISKMEVEGDLRRRVASDVKRLQEIGSYRGYRHRKKLPSRGQKTQCNARTRRGGKRIAIAGKKKVTK